MSYKTIKVKNYLHVTVEREASAAITPGMLIELLSTGKVRKHATALGDAMPMFALEDSLQGKGIDSDYAAGDQVQCWIPTRGDEVYALLADEETIVIGDFLASDGFGKLKKNTAENWGSNDAQVANTVYSMPIVAVALEAKDLSTLPEGSESSAGGDYYNPRILVRVV